MEIISAILERDWPAVEEKIKMVETLVDWVQLDVCDGLFVPSRTWDNPRDIFSLKSKIKLEAHLMINEPWLKMDEWLSSPIRRVVAHVEAFSSPESVKFGEIVFAAKRYGKEVVWGFKKETDWEPYKDLMRVPEARVLFLSVEAGRQGQEFDRGIFDKIKSLKSTHPHVNVSVDGGINLDIARELKSYGAYAVVVGSNIFKSGDQAEIIQKFKSL